MSGFSVEFEFEIGDLVFVRGAQHTESHRPKLYCVAERIGQECHSGIQRLYRLVGMEGLIPEIALTQDEPPYRPRPPAYAEDLARIAESYRIKPWKFEEKP